MFDRMVTGATSGSSAQAATAALTRFGLLNADRNVEKPVEDPVKEEDGILSIDVAERVMKWHAEAIGRCVELSPANDV